MRGGAQRYRRCRKPVYSLGAPRCLQTSDLLWRNTQEPVPNVSRLNHKTVAVNGQIKISCSEIHAEGVSKEELPP